MIETAARSGGWFIPAFLCAMFISCAAPVAGVIASHPETIAAKRPKGPSCPDCKPANRPFRVHQQSAEALAVAE